MADNVLSADEQNRIISAVQEEIDTLNYRISNLRNQTYNNMFSSIQVDKDDIIEEAKSFYNTSGAVIGAILSAAAQGSTFLPFDGRYCMDPASLSGISIQNLEFINKEDPILSGMTIREALNKERDTQYSAAYCINKDDTILSGHTLNSFIELVKLRGL